MTLTTLSPPSSVDQPHQERGESCDDVPAGHGLQEGAAGDQNTGAQSQTGLSSAGWRSHSNIRGHFDFHFFC